MKVLVRGAIVALLAAFPWSTAVAQDPTADVRTWDGQTRRLSQPSLQVVYSIITEKDQQGITPAGEAVSAGAPLELRGNVKALSQFLDKDVVSRWARRRSESLTIIKEGVETRVPVESIQTLQFARQPVTRNALPPYFAPSHFRYTATAVLNDGSRVDGDYVNLGATVLTGETPQGRVEIPWNQIQAVRFSR